VLTPHGLGSYVRGHVSGWTDRDAEKRAAFGRAAGLRWVSLMVEAVGGRVIAPADTVRAARAFHEQGIAVSLWTFPSPTRPAARADAAFDRAREALAAAGIPRAGRILDLEPDPKGPVYPSPGWAAELVARTAEDLDPGEWLMVTSMPVPAWHPKMPWEAMRHPRACGGPQFYRSALSPATVSRGYRGWGELYTALVPAVPAYDVSGGSMSPAVQIRETLDRVCLDGATGRPRVPAAALWSDPQIDRAEAAVLRAWVERVGW